MNVNNGKEDQQKMNIQRKIHNWKRRRQKARSLGNKGQKRRWKKRNKRPIPIWGIIGVFAAVLLLVCVGTRATALFKDKVVEIDLTVQDAEMYVGEEKPVFTAEVSCEGDTSVVLDEETDYTIQDLIDELQNGSGYTLESDGDGMEVGEYSISAVLTSAVATPLNTEWLDKVAIHTKKGTFTVKEIDKEHEEELNKAAEEAYDQPMIALTFDDGPGKYTSKLLDALEQYGAHATFFMVGKNVPKYPEEVKRMLEIGCELGNHSYDHAQLTKLTPEGIQGQVNDTNGEIEKVAGKSATLLRPPYGAVDDNVKQNVGMPMILWSVDTLDWKTKDANATIENVLTNAGDGDIILMHDIHEQSVEAAIQLIPALQEKGYKLVTVSEMAKARGVKLENGEKYFGFWKKTE